MPTRSHREAIAFPLMSRILRLLAIMAAATIVPGEPVLAGAPAPKPWVRVVSDSRNFTVLMPHQPKVQMRSVKTETGPILVSIYVCEGLSTYLVAYNDYTAGIGLDDRRKVLNGAVQGSLRSMGAQIVSQKSGRFTGFPAHSITFRSPGYLGRSRFVLVGSRLYQQTAIYPASAADRADVDRFMASFKLLK